MLIERSSGGNNDVESSLFTGVMATLETAERSRTADVVPRRSGRWIDLWDPEDEEFWRSTGARIARRNLILSIITDHLGFCVWVMWTVVVINLGNAGLPVTLSEQFVLALVPNLVGSVLRIPYSFAVPRFGGRAWTTWSGLVLLVPSLLLAIVVPSRWLAHEAHSTQFWVLLACAATAGLGGANFASSMANISFFYPERRKGYALGLNAAGGNLGAAVGQLAVPLVIIVGVPAGAVALVHHRVHLAYAGWLWVPLLVLSAAAAWRYMDSLSQARADRRPYVLALRDRHTWALSLLYVGTFGSFIGYSFALPLVIKNSFPTFLHAHPFISTYLAGLSFLGALVGSLSWPLGGWLADRYGGAPVTLAMFAGMATFTGLAIGSLDHASFGLFLGSFLFVFLCTGMGNGSIYKLIPTVIASRADAPGRSGGDRSAALVDLKRQAAAVIGIAGAVGALGGVGVQVVLRQASLRVSALEKAARTPAAQDAVAAAHSAWSAPALWAFLVSYLGFGLVTWVVYLRRCSPQAALAGGGRVKRVVVIGHGMVANKVVEALVHRSATRTWEVVVVGEERQPAYDRVHLSQLFEGYDPSDLDLLDSKVAADPAVTLISGEKVTSIDRGAQVVSTDSGRRIDYDLAVLATGSTAFVPPVTGCQLPGCFVYRTVSDVDAIRNWTKGRAHGVVVGGGLLGLEAANALRHCGVATEVVEVADHLMPMQVDATGGELLRRRIEDHGLSVHPATRLVSVLAGEDGSVAAVELVTAGGDGRPERLSTEMVVFAAGIRPRDELARECGIEVGERGGIVVDERCQTSDPAIYAVGECALAGGRIHGLVSPGYQMARVVAENICGGDVTFRAGDTPTKLKLLGVDVASFGDAHAHGDGASTMTFTDSVARVHRRLVIGPDGQVVGGVLVGDASGFDTMVSVATGDLEPPGDLMDLLLPAGPRPATEESGGGFNLRPSATVCSCENVSAGDICTVIDDAIAGAGHADVAAVKSRTRAGTGCGGCVPQLTDLVRNRLAEAGIEASRRLCEHFSQSRQELCDIVRLTGVTTFSELLLQYGSGAGCEVCKPAVASILASVVGGYILDGEGAAIQDSNDHFLANLQRDGTYSVVPRVPGGEITPERLIVLGEVARRFKLYVKITGGQRIDLLGAQVDDLPAIWAALVDAGFESGHAYGKAVRTVKSCVGTNWCRFGVQDSTALAIELELRYRGLRSPHKIKMAVSGCARECAEAQSKDVGVIATERGWNLYVCGNGGTRPRHADLLAADVDKATLIRYVDRFLIYYIRTADRLQRTASWLEAIDGGLEHVRQVVVYDSLGLGGEMEAAMNDHAERYRCEWTETLQDPGRLRRFRTFVNTDTTDPDIAMVYERGQPRPAFQWERVELLPART